MPTATDDERALHARLLAGDLTASAEVAALYLPGLVEALSRKYPEVVVRDEAMVRDAATDALLDYVASPASFDPERRTLRGYLFMAAKGDLLNALAKARREQGREKSVGPVELRQSARNTGVETPKAERELQHQELRARLNELVPDPMEQQVLELMLERERDTMAYAIVMGIVEMDGDARQDEVKRMKDKLRARLKRAGWEGFIERLP